MISYWLGQMALSASRIQSLLTRYSSQGLPLSSLQARSLFVMQHQRESDVYSIDQQQKIAHLLQAEPAELEQIQQGLGTNTFISIARLGTRSPWSSKATDILKRCGLGEGVSLECGIYYQICDASTCLELTEEQRQWLVEPLFDPMTQSLVSEVNQLERLFERADPKLLKTIPVKAQGRSALVCANQSLALALSDDEIDFLWTAYQDLARDPTDVELMMFAQANSEHCRHKIFNANWVIAEQVQQYSLFDMIRHTYKCHQQGVLSAYSDNAAVIEGALAQRFFPHPRSRDYYWVSEPIHTVLKVETHNHPTAIAPYPGAATGAGGEIRDEGATGQGAKPKAGLVGFTVSNLHIPDFEQAWEVDYGKPARMASALTIMLEGPIGAAAYNNEFGRPNILGYFRSFELKSPLLGDERIRGYHKPIMLAGGIGNIRPGHVHKQSLPVQSLLVVLGGPALLIGLGGGAASSVQSGTLSADLDFASVQRENPEMQRRAQEVIDTCWQAGERNPIRFIHDVGAGGLSNALPELVKDAGCGGLFDLQAIPSDDSSLSPLELWCNEAQERYVLGIAEQDYEFFKRICQRERCPYAVVGCADAEKNIVLRDPCSSVDPVNLPQSVLFGKPPQLTCRYTPQTCVYPALDLSQIVLKEALKRVLLLPAVASKSFLVTIADRSVTGLVARDPMVGPWQVPVADCGITALGFKTYAGEALALGERSPLALVNAAASARMAVGEALTNLLSSEVRSLEYVKLSANWMAACGDPIEDQNLYEAVEAVGLQLCPALGVTIPVGKDSLSMRTQWHEASMQKQVISPVSLVVTALAPLKDIRKHWTPQLCLKEPSYLLLLDLGQSQNRLGGSALAQVYAQIGDQVPDLDDPQLLKKFAKFLYICHQESLVQAYHDRSDGGLWVTLLEMAFASHCGLRVYLPDDCQSDELAQLGGLFAEELGAVIQVTHACYERVVGLAKDCGVYEFLHKVAEPDTRQSIQVFCMQTVLFEENRIILQRLWAQTSYRMQALRDNPECAREDYDALLDENDPGLTATHVPFEWPQAPNVVGTRPTVAILREQGVNGQVEMAAAFDCAGFNAIDVHMNDLLQGDFQLSTVQGLVACGGFSYGDVLGAGRGWAASILYHAALREQFQQFFARQDSFTLGVCNGCQMLSQLSSLIPGAQHWPSFEKNRSEQFESRLVLTEVMDSSAVLLQGMQGAHLPVVVAHGQGRVDLSSMKIDALLTQKQLSLSYLDHYGQITERYPFNPNGSTRGLTGLCSEDGRVLIMMPHPERMFRFVQHSWCPADWGEYGEYGPWFQLFVNAKKWVDQQ